MASLNAMRGHAICKAFFQKLRAAGQPAKVTLIAVARKLLIRLNTLLKNLKIQTPVAALST